MELKQTQKKIKCDVPACKNVCTYCFEFKKHFVAGNFYVCKTCLNQMYTAMGKELVPQSIKHIYKKNNEVENKE